MKNNNIYLKLTVLSIILIFILIFSSGCTDQTEEIQITEVEIPQDLQTGLDSIINDLSIIYSTIDEDLKNLAEEVGNAKDISDIEKIGLNYYADNHMINCLIYCDENGNPNIIPVQIEKDLSKYIPFPTKEELEENNGRIHLSGQFISDYGYVDVDYKAVYDNSGNYKGYIIIISDMYLSINLHPEIAGKEKSYGDFICFITDANGEIVYSSAQETIGLSVSADKKFSNGIALISEETEDTGAYKYTSRAFYNYLGDKKSEKITAWKKMTANNAVQTVYLVKEIDKPEIIYKDVYEITTEQGLKYAEDLYSYANMHSIDEAKKRVNNGDFGYNLYIMDFDGNVVSAPYKGIIGLNYLNNRGVNGYSYVGGAITTAKQGGGFVYYIYPIDGTVDCRAGQCSFAYVLPLNDDTFIFSHFSGTTDNIKTGNAMRTSLTEASRAIMKEVNINGIESVIDTINSDPENAANYFAPDVKVPISDIVVMDYYSFVYASTMHPENIGKVMTKYTDLYGGSTTRKIITLAKNGSGFMPDLSASTRKENSVDMWTICVVPVNNEYLINVISYSGTNDDILSPYI